MQTTGAMARVRCIAASFGDGPNVFGQRTHRAVRAAKSMRATSRSLRTIVEQVVECAAHRPLQTADAAAIAIVAMTMMSQRPSSSRSRSRN
jgi:hypothetical protein